MNRIVLIHRRFTSLALAYLLIAAGVLLFSYATEIIAKIQPCSLCKAQRVPYFCLLIFSPLLIFRKWDRLGLVLVSLILAFSLGLAGYHLLVIGRLISDPCAVPHAPQTLAEFQSMLSAPLPCATASWQLLGIPVSAYNLVLSTGMLLSLIAKGFRRA